MISLYLRAFAVTITSLVVGLAMIGAIVVVPLVMGDGALDYGGRRVTAPVLFCVVALGSAAIYRLGPSRRPARWRWIAVGALTVASGWLAVSTLLSWYLSNIANYALMYGSLGTVIALMFWFFISIYIVLLGAELAAETEHQTMVDTTVGPERPMGRRGAYVADTVGKQAGR
jgi:membrane protein